MAYGAGKHCLNSRSRLGGKCLWTYMEPMGVEGRWAWGPLWYSQNQLNNLCYSAALFHPFFWTLPVSFTCSSSCDSFTSSSLPTQNPCLLWHQGCAKNICRVNFGFLNNLSRDFFFFFVSWLKLAIYVNTQISGCDFCKLEWQCQGWCPSSKGSHFPKFQADWGGKSHSRQLKISLVEKTQGDMNWCMNKVFPQFLRLLVGELLWLFSRKNEIASLAPFLVMLHFFQHFSSNLAEFWHWKTYFN